jgi:hypothetical protein
MGATLLYGVEGIQGEASGEVGEYEPLVGNHPHSNHPTITYMKTKLIIFAATAITAFAFGQTTTTEKTTTVTTQTTPAPVTGEHAGKMGTVASFIPTNSIIISQDAFTHPTKYMMAKEVVFDKASGAAVSPDSIQPGTRVGVQLNGDGQVNHITLLDPR